MLLQINGWPTAAGPDEPTVKFECSADLLPSSEWTTVQLTVTIEYNTQSEPLTAILSALQWMIQTLHGKFLIIHSGHIKLPDFSITHYINLLQTSGAKFLIWDKPPHGPSAFNEQFVYMPIIGVSPTATEHLSPTTIQVDSISKQLSSPTLSPSEFPSSNGFTSHELLFLQYAELLQSSGVASDSPSAVTSDSSVLDVILRIIPAMLAGALSKRSPSSSTITALQAFASSMAVIYKSVSYTHLTLPTIYSV